MSGPVLPSSHLQSKETVSGPDPLMSYTLWPGGAIPGSGAGTGPHCRREIIKPARRVSAAPDIFGAHLYTA